MEIEITFSRRAARFEAEDILEARDWFRRLGRNTRTLDMASEKERTFAEAMSSDADIVVFDTVTAALDDGFLAGIAAEKEARLKAAAAKYAEAPAYVQQEYVNSPMWYKGDS